MKKQNKRIVYIILAAALWFALTVCCSAEASESQEKTAVTISRSKLVLVKGKTYSLSVTGGKGTVKWKSSNKKVAVVTQKGKVTAKGKGSAKITATVGKRKVTCKVTVYAAILSKTKLSLTMGEKKTLKVTGGSGKTVWKSNNSAVAAVDKRGRVTAKAAGTAYIYAYIGQSKLRCRVTVKEDRWSRILRKYRNNDSVNQLIFVKYKGGSNADVLMYNKGETGWNCILDCSGYVGKNGIGKKREGDGKTPTGTFELTSAFGIKKNPGAKMDYVKVNKYLYWCGDPEHYNQLIDVRKNPHQCQGEHLITYVPHYNYGMFLNYNPDCIYGKGSAIFLHCTGSNKYTGGCIAVSQSNMLKIMRNAEQGTRICIYEK